MLEKLGRRRVADNAQFQAELGQHFAERGNAPLANAARTKARTLFEQQLADEPDNDALATELVNVLLDARLTAVLQGRAPKDNAERSHPCPAGLRPRSGFARRRETLGRCRGGRPEACQRPQGPVSLQRRLRRRSRCRWDWQRRCQASMTPPSDRPAREQSLDWLKADLRRLEHASRIRHAPGSSQHRAVTLESSLAKRQRPGQQSASRRGAGQIPGRGTEGVLPQLWADVAELLKKAEKTKQPGSVKRRSGRQPRWSA